MTRGLFIFAITAGLLACSSRQENSSEENIDDNWVTTSINAPTDTVEIWDSLAIRPFLFETWRVSLDSVLMFLPSSVELALEVGPSQYHHNANDTTTKIKLGRSLIQYVKTPSVGYIDHAVVVDRDIKFQRDIKIGDNYEDVSQKLVGIPKTKTKFRKIYVNFGEATSTLIMEFSDDRLSKVTYCPYTG